MRELRGDDLVQHGEVRDDPEELVGELGGAGRGAGDGGDVDVHDGSLPAGTASVSAARAGNDDGGAFDGVAHEDEPAGGSGDGAAEEEQAAFGVAFDDLEVQGGDAAVAVLAGHAGRP